ncbi:MULTISPECIES: DUF4185 domain-containing protein [unclassified Novosphingobium]|uniref:DUF4185 domain-containing protein n=1 Tax=unclassified Novosphingobium TaxID=2644732 RepID=UPI00180C84AB|nr:MULTISPECIES: DUF4185 domain-containing protein [unclassified Novosphingobium]MBB3357211.1 hypothetical protein [Novosphingobium sp. BK256]MBB3374127.1 hypothetical protein [Novosphingobium sp. BK280]MBB3378539.1 hypothetical protein [Novosphingobium sp. BK258]MBB3419677.1 hypothetical protein [Novosphingobium sp. BK267]MBB3448002.1 hypothetical protein [Novosphingobium sp. BK352]
MSDRRTFLQGSLASLATGMAGLPTPASANPAHRQVIGAVRREDTIVRLGGLGDGYKMTLCPDGTQLVVVNDGPGWNNPPTTFYNTRLWTVTGNPPAPRFAMMPGYPDLDRDARPDAPRYYGHGVIQVGQRIYQFVATHDAAQDRPQRWRGAKLILSDDGGTTWRNRDGTTPVVWEDWAEQRRGPFTFFDEPDGALSLLTFLQQMRGQPAAPGGWLTLYGLDGNTDGRMNHLLLLRAPVDAVTDRAAYRFFAGRDAIGQPIWSADIAARRPVHRFPRGWVNHANLFPGDLVVESWLPSVVYNAPLGVYMMASAGIGVGADGTEFGRSSYFGLWVAHAPWGPWRQIHEEAPWCPGGDQHARAYAPQIAPGWIAADGRSFWLVWSDLRGIRAFGHDEALLDAALAKASTPAERATIETRFLQQYMPGFSFNAQRVDLRLAPA